MHNWTKLDRDKIKENFPSINSPKTKNEKNTALAETLINALKKKLAEQKAGLVSPKTPEEKKTQDAALAGLDRMNKHLNDLCMFAIDFSLLYSDEPTDSLIQKLQTKLENEDASLSTDGLRTRIRSMFKSQDRSLINEEYNFIRDMVLLKISDPFHYIQESNKCHSSTARDPNELPFVMLLSEKTERFLERFMNHPSILSAMLGLPETMKKELEKVVRDTVPLTPPSTVLRCVNDSMALPPPP
jgi:hypothetical protein